MTDIKFEDLHINQTIYYKVTITTTNGEILTWDNITEDKIKQLNKPFAITIKEKNKYKYLYAGGISSIECEEVK